MLLPLPALPELESNNVIDRYRKHTNTANMVKPHQLSAYSKLYRLATNRIQCSSCRTVANEDRMALWGEESERGEIEKLQVIDWLAKMQEAGGST